MFWWIAGGVVVLALVWLLVTLATVLGSLRRLAAATLVLNRRLADGSQRLQQRLLELRKKSEALQESLVVAQERAATIQVRRGEADTSGPYRGPVGRQYDGFDAVRQ